MARERKKEIDERNAVIVESSGNVFADLGLSDPEEKQTKVKIAFALNEILANMPSATQAEIAERLHTDQPKVSAVKNYKLQGLSVERLLEFLTALEYDIDIEIKPTRSKGRHQSGRINVKMTTAA